MTRHPGAALIAAWGVANVVLSTLMFVFTDDLMSHVVYWLANVFVLVMAAIAVRARNPAGRMLPEASAGVFALALAVVFLALGAGIGSWAFYVGAAILLVAVVLLGMERST